MVGVIGVIHLAGIVIDAVADDKVVNVKKEVVRRNLVEHLACYLDAWSLVFHDHPRLAIGAVENTVAAQTFLPTLQSHLVGKETGRVGEVIGEIVYEMLPHPLLGSECNELLTLRVEYHHAPVHVPDVGRVGRKVKFFH